MKTILVPIDFSKNASHAAEYALMVAKQIQANIFFLHIHMPNLVPEYNLPVGMEQYLAQNQLEAIQEMEKFVAEFVKKSKLPAQRINHKIEYGFVAEKIVETAENICARYIIMGTKGVSDGFERWIGTVAQKVMKISKCAVWIIPDHISIHFPKKFVYAADLEKDENNTKHKILNIMQEFDGSCKQVHMEEQMDDFGNTDIMVKQEILKETADSSLVKTSHIQGENIIEGIDKYIKKNRPDVLILAHYHKPFFKKLFEPSITKHFVQEANLPILILNKDQNLYFG